jgi:arginine exporter protein ArgO
MRHNFTNVASSTPYLNNVSIFYEGSDTGAINDRHEWFLPLILFSGIIFIIVYGVKRN